MRNIYLILENFVDKIFAKKFLVSVVKIAFIIMFFIGFFYILKIDIIVKYLIFGLLFCLLYVLTFHLNEFLKKEEEYLKKIFSK